MIKKLSTLMFAATMTMGTAAAAQECGGGYQVKSGDSLSLIADRMYSDAQKWSAIYQANLASVGTEPDRLAIGVNLRIPCIGGLPVGLGGNGQTQTANVAGQAESGAILRPVLRNQEAGDQLSTTATRVVTFAGSGNTGAATLTTQTAAVTAPAGNQPLEVKLVTAGDFAPFTQRGYLNEGMVAQIVNTAFGASPSVDEFEVIWIEDWSAHLNPLVQKSIIDIGFPWYKPDCAGDPDNYRCQTFHFSEPMFEMLILLFTSKSDPLVFTKDDDMIGKALCRPAGYFTHDLDKNGRNWLSEEKVRLEQPATIKECFELLEEGKVAAVSINEFTGRSAIKDLALEDKVEIVQSRPLSIEGHHVVVAKSHPRAAEMLEAANAGLRQIKSSGRYQEIID